MYGLLGEEEEEVEEEEEEEKDLNLLQRTYGKN